jgi:O-antigen/teichoic acid export membrane protein
MANALPPSSTGIAKLEHSHFNASSHSDGLSMLTTRGGIYLGLRYGLGVVVSLGNMLVLTRWIGPHAYGLFVTALGLTSFLAALARGGIDTYIVRMEGKPDKRVYDVATTLILGHSILLVAGSVAALPLLVRWYGSREFVPAYLVTLLTIPLAGLAGPPTAKLERELNFRAVAGIELGGQVLALIVSMAMAWGGFGVWAPVTGLLVWQFWAAGGALAAAGLAPALRFDRAQARAMLAFGAGYSASLRVWQLRTLVNPLLVGRFAGPEAVAFVALAIRIAEGLGFVRIAAGRLAIAALARLRHDPPKFQSALENALHLQVLTLGPLLCVFALAAPALVPRLIGTCWLPSLQVYPFVAAAVLVNSLYNLQASALFVAGRQWVVMRAYVWHVALLVGTTVILLPRLGILGYGWAELAACAGYGVLHAGLARVISISYRRLAPAVLVFVAPLFTLSIASTWSVALWIPVLAFAAFAIWNWTWRPPPRIWDALAPAGLSPIASSPSTLPRTGT